MPLIIGLHGAKFSGKDSFYKIVKKYYPHLNVRRVAYAAPITNQVMHIFNLRDENEYDAFKRSQVVLLLNEDEDRNVDGRRIVREIGMGMRKDKPDRFVEYVDSQIDMDPSAIWFITDVRFDNEIEHKYRLNYPLVKIRRVGVEYDGHETETEFPDHVCDYFINNRTNKYQLYEEDVCKLFEEILDNYNKSEKQ